MSTKIFNVEAYQMDIEFTQNDTIDLAFSVTKNKVVYDMTGMTVTMTVREIGIGNTLIKSLSSAGTSPAITIYIGTIHIVSSGFANVGKYNYDIQITNGAVVQTVAKGVVMVVKEITV